MGLRFLREPIGYEMQIDEVDYRPSGSHSMDYYLYDDDWTEEEESEWWDDWEAGHSEEEEEGDKKDVTSWEEVK
jgi:hypothetical protein